MLLFKTIKNFNISLDHQINNQIHPKLDAYLQMRLIALFNKYWSGNLEIHRFTKLWIRLIGPLSIIQDYKFYRYFKYKINFFPSYGATGEDILLGKIFKKQIGFYVDVGALHPINGSNTYHLYKKGWKGINFDLMEDNIKLFKIFRPRDISLSIAISSKSGLINSYIFDSGSGLNTLERNWAEKWSKVINKNFKTVKVKKEKLTNMLDKYNCPKNFDLLNIDVENHELDVLRGLDFKIYKPKIITIEIHTKKTKDIFKSPTYKYLEKENYELISQYYQTSFFKIKNF